jgi:glyoxylase-like metal-dependent hydrolase (beta-lactamase superfamily II)
MVMTMTMKRVIEIGFAAVAASVMLVSAAHGGAPMARTQAPGYYRMMLGDFEITALSDGTLALPMATLLTNTTPARVDKALARAFLADPLETSVNGYLVNTGSKLVLIDTGAGNLFGPTLGRLVANLKASGYEPGDVDVVCITHMHGDHVGGLMAGDRLAFPNAVVRADKRDADYWLSQARLAAAGKDDKDMFQGAMASLNPYASAGKLVPFDGDTEIVPGVRAHSSYGHTPGHATYVIESKGKRLVLWGDLMHVAAVQFPDPSVTIRFDTDSRAAAAQRKKAFADAARNGDWVAGAHIAFPGIGHLRQDGAGYVFVPANYSAGR